MPSGSDEEDEKFIYKCNKCPGQTLTATDRDEHRVRHRQENLGKRDNKRHDKYLASIKSKKNNSSP